MEIGILNARLYYNFHLRRLSIISHRDIELSIKTSVFSTFFFLFISLDKMKKGRKKKRSANYRDCLPVLELDIIYIGNKEMAGEIYFILPEAPSSKAPSSAPVA